MRAPAVMGVGSCEENSLKVQNQAENFRFEALKNCLKKNLFQKLLLLHGLNHVSYCTHQHLKKISEKYLISLKKFGKKMFTNNRIISTQLLNSLQTVKDCMALHCVCAGHSSFCMVIALSLFCAKIYV